MELIFDYSEIPSQYKKISAYTAPEYYSSHLNNPDHIKALVVFSQDKTEPFVVTDTPDVILSNLFDDIEPTPIIFNNGHTMYIDPYLQWSCQMHNTLATHYVRANLLTQQGSFFPESVKGNCVILGHFDHTKKRITGDHHSVSYEVVQEFVFIHQMLNEKVRIEKI